MTEVIDTIEALRARLGSGPEAVTMRASSKARVVVMTMGALHAGHIELVNAASAWLGNRGISARDAEIVVTDFVNPLQFTDAKDLATYPRTLDDDVAMCRAAGVDVVFAPTAAEMYPDGDPIITVDPGSMGMDLEGMVRPGHFRGMLTVVNRLLMLTTPTAAMFGEKDYQQLTLIRRMVTDLLIPVNIVGVPTVREPDGLAMSSRNRRLNPRDREHALAVPQALARVRDMLAEGAAPDVVEDSVARWLDGQPGVEGVDYVAVRGVGLDVAPEAGEGRALVAAVVGGVRLIDNCAVTIGESR